MGVEEQTLTRDHKDGVDAIALSSLRNFSTAKINIAKRI
jgi:hypothetical protein